LTAIGLPKHRSGKVRDVYEIGHDRLLMVASDRISAFDVVLDEPIPDKGRVLTGLSTFWFDQTGDIVENHLISADPTDFPETAGPGVAGRAMMVKAARPVLMECVVRGYLFGSAWSEYQKHGTVNGEPLSPGMALAEQLPEPIFTPTTKVSDGGHDEFITFDDVVGTVGSETANRLRDLTLEIYQRGAEHALDRGIIIADTKFEFGLLDGEMILIDEVLTPDSSRFWPADRYEPGKSQPSFDKQFVRDYLETLDWNKQPPGPTLPADVVAKTTAKYLEAYERLTGKRL